MYGINPSIQQQTILTLGVLDLSIENTNPEGKPQRFLGLTFPNSLVSNLLLYQNTHYNGVLVQSTTPKSIVKLRFSTTTTPNLNTKETRIKLTLCGFTYCFYPDIHWISDLTVFAKNPPGVRPYLPTS